MIQKRLFLPFVVVALLLLVSPVLAGGWSVATLDELPECVTVGEPLTIGFVVRQHGIRIVEGLTPEITAVHQDSRESIEVTVEEDEAGHYVAELTFPSDGIWEWSVNAFGPEQSLPALTVLPASASDIEETTVSDSLSSAEKASLEIQQGAALFVAKGCIVCHQHNDLNVGEYESIAVGPELTTYSENPDFLHKWLEDPSALKPSAAMPTLDLSDDEIEALIAFLNAEEPEDFSQVVIPSQCKAQIAASK